MILEWLTIIGKYDVEIRVRLLQASACKEESSIAENNF